MWTLFSAIFLLTKRVWSILNSHTSRGEGKGRKAEYSELMWVGYNSPIFPTAFEMEGLNLTVRSFLHGGMSRFSFMKSTRCLASHIIVCPRWTIEYGRNISLLVVVVMLFL